MGTRQFFAATLALGLASFAGCGGAGGGSELRTMEKDLGNVAREYGQFLEAHRGAPPNDDAEFRAFVEPRVANYGKSLEEFLKSPRDGEAYVIVTGKKIFPPDSSLTPWAAYEKTGVDGKRYAAAYRGGVFEFSPEEFSAQVPAN